jgi:hypothetical protein
MLRYLACLRFELMTIGLLLALPLGAFSTLIGNLFQLEAWRDLALVIALACVVAWQTMVMVVAWIIVWRVPLFTLLAAPMAVTVLWVADLDGWSSRVAGLGVGVGLAFAVLWLTTVLQQFATAPGTSTGWLLDPRSGYPARFGSRPVGRSGSPVRPSACSARAFSAPTAGSSRGRRGAPVKEGRTPASARPPPVRHSGGYWRRKRLAAHPIRRLSPSTRSTPTTTRLDGPEYRSAAPASRQTRRPRRTRRSADG